MMQIHDESACTYFEEAYIRGGGCPAEQWIQLSMICVLSVLWIWKTIHVSRKCADGVFGCMFVSGGIR